MENYRECAVLGEGGFGIATLVERKADHKKLVVKTIQINDGNERSRAQTEVDIIKNASHYNIIKLGV